MTRAPAGTGPGRFEFIDHLVSREQRFSVGIEARTGQPYVSIPVSNQRVDYEEYYAIDQALFERFLADLDAALAFVVRCRQRQEDARLFYSPSAKRGTPL